MKRHLLVLGWVIFILLGNFIFAQYPKKFVQLKHCISGNYDVRWLPISSVCDKLTHHFNWSINQESECGKKIWGKITESGVTRPAFYYTGEVLYLNKNCVRIKGRWNDTKTSVFGEFYGTLCKNGPNQYGKIVKWVMEKGYLTSNFDTGCPDAANERLIMWYKSPLFQVPQKREIIKNE